MSGAFVLFDDMRRRVAEVLQEAEIPDIDIYMVRNLFGRLRMSVSEAVEEDEACRAKLQRLAAELSKALGARGYPAENDVLFVSDALLKTLRDTTRPIEGFDKVFWADRLLTGSGWWTVGDPRPERHAQRWTLYSIKGGVGRSTTAAVLARHLARKGERVLVVDLDLESPGLSSAMLNESERPDLGIADWFVEELVGQGDGVIAEMTTAPAWVEDLPGAVAVAPAHGRKPGEYLAKLGRVYMDRADDPWTARLERMLSRLEAEFSPTVTLLESRSGLHDIAAATVTDIDAEVLLFAADSESSWTGYGILFDHWRERDLATEIRGRLRIVSALTPELDTERYLQRFRQRAWDLFRERLYDDLSAPIGTDDEFSFDLDAEEAPHNPIAVHWTRGLAAGASLRDLERTTVEQAYTHFLGQFDRLASVGDWREDR